MVTALYYPHTVIQSRDLIRTALLLWDQVECIVPQRGWKMEFPFKEKLYNEALELIAKPCVPKMRDRNQAHSEVKEYIKEESSRLFLHTALGRHYPRRYMMYPEKFLKETWRELEYHGLARWDAMTSDWGVPPALGLLMMSSLADACAGTQKQKVTDRVDAYSMLAKARATLLGAPFVDILIGC